MRPEFKCLQHFIKNTNQFRSFRELSHKDKHADLKLVLKESLKQGAEQGLTYLSVAHRNYDIPAQVQVPVRRVHEPVYFDSMFEYQLIHIQG